ncbi:MAG: cytochrome c-type biogenesis protein CcmH [Gammaproteobacteria bacterium]|nr:cytochrome c-type biogenesis protein CcmH [Gammaproteobacteria bacterium]
MRSALTVGLLLCTFSLWAAGTEQQNEQLEARYRALTSELRCLVCQNESIADSHADLAKDLRNQVRAMMEQGKSDREIMEYLTARYGDFVRFRPPFKPVTAALWFGPFVLMALGGGLLMVYMARRRKRVSNAPLSSSEQEKLATLLHRTENEGKG